MTKPANTLSDDVSRLKGIIAEQILSLQTFEEEIERHRSELQHKEEELARAKAYAERLEEMVRLLRHRHFGRTSEKVKGEGHPRQLGIFNEAEALEEQPSEESSSEEPTVEVKARRRRGKPKRIALPADLPREDVVIDLPEEEKRCPEGHELKLIGEDVSEQLDVIPAQVKVIRTIRKKYACPACGDCVKRAPLPNHQGTSHQSPITNHGFWRFPWQADMKSGWAARGGRVSSSRA